MKRAEVAGFDVFIDAVPDAMIIVDQAGKMALVNGHAARMFRYNRHELLGQPVEILVPHSFPNGLELSGRRKDGTEFPVEISFSALETHEGVLVTSAVRDITDRKRQEENIRRQNQALEEQNRRVHEASRMKSAFLANMSHELRSPLNSIIGFAELMHDGKLGPVAPGHHEYLGDILTSARHLLHVINDVVDLSKIESGTMEFFSEAIDLPLLVTEVSDQVRMLAESKTLHFSMEIASVLTTIVADAPKLKQVLYNYVSNAFKFTPDGGQVIVRATVENDQQFRLEVEDTGGGIRPEDLGRLFVDFQQLAAKQYQGTGLGLALTKRLVEAQGGSVGVTTRFGEGSCFFAVLPRPSGQTPT